MKKWITGMKSARSWTGQNRMLLLPCISVGVPKQDSITIMESRSDCFRRNCSDCIPIKCRTEKIPLVRGFDDYFLAPHSRHTETPASEIHKCDAITVLAESEEAGVFLAYAEEGKKIFVNGHPEYDRYTLDKEYHRDLDKGLPIHIPRNYYPNDDPTQKPDLQWRSHSNNLYTNWLNYYVYQTTPYEL